MTKCLKEMQHQCPASRSCSLMVVLWNKMTWDEMWPYWYFCENVFGTSLKKGGKDKKEKVENKNTQETDFKAASQFHNHIV